MDYRVFSSGSFALCDLIKLGAKTIGDEIETSMNHFGNNNWIYLDGYRFSISDCYFNLLLIMALDAIKSLKKLKSYKILQPYIFKPDIYIIQNKTDYIEGSDIVLNYTLKYSKENYNNQ